MCVLACCITCTQPTPSLPPRRSQQRTKTVQQRRPQQHTSFRTPPRLRVWKFRRRVFKRLLQRRRKHPVPLRNLRPTNRGVGLPRQIFFFVILTGVHLKIRVHLQQREQREQHDMIVFKDSSESVANSYIIHDTGVCTPHTNYNIGRYVPPVLHCCTTHRPLSLSFAHHFFLAFFAPPPPPTTSSSTLLAPFNNLRRLALSTTCCALLETNCNAFSIPLTPHRHIKLAMSWAPRI